MTHNALVVRWSSLKTPAELFLSSDLFLEFTVERFQLWAALAIAFSSDTCSCVSRN